jgi:superfamily II DNA helicase RecQ
MTVFFATGLNIVCRPLLTLMKEDARRAEAVHVTAMYAMKRETTAG